MKPADRLELRTLAFALLASLLLWNLPFGGVLLYPFKLLATWLHEMSHGLTMLLTGVGFDHVTIYRDTSGLAYGTSEAGPFGRAVIAAAGYMGTPLVGRPAALVVSAERAAGALGAAAARRAADRYLADGDRRARGRSVRGRGRSARSVPRVPSPALALAVPARWRLAICRHFVAAQSCVNLDPRYPRAAGADHRRSSISGKIAGASRTATTLAAATFGTTATWAV